MDRLGDHRLRCYGFEIKEKHAELEPFVGTRMYFVVHLKRTVLELLSESEDVGTDGLR